MYASTLVSFPGFLTLILWFLSKVGDNEYWLTTVYLKQRRISHIQLLCYSALATIYVDWILGKGGLGL